MNAWQPLRLAILLIVACSITQSLRADIFELVTGGEIRGQLINPEQKPRTSYQIKTPSGTILALATEQVERIVAQTEEEEEYERRSITIPDTADGHWQLANWCLEKKLLQERRHHLERVIELDPEHAEARRLLGYQQVHGAWLSREEEMKLRGYVLHEGDWRTPQDAEIREREKKLHMAESEWRKNTRLWRRWLGGRNPSRVEEAKNHFLEANDPLAVPALVDLLNKEKIYEAQKLLLEALSDIKHPLTVETIATNALNHPNSEIRHQCIEYLIQWNDPSLALRFIPVLQSSNNHEVNRAAEILEAIGCPEAISPLIDALVTEHKIKNPNAGRTSAGFRPGGGGGGLSMGGKPYVTVPIKNQKVLHALIKLSGRQSFEYDEYDEKAWHQWYALSRREGDVNMRRDG